MDRSLRELTQALDEGNHILEKTTEFLEELQKSKHPHHASQEELNQLRTRIENKTHQLKQEIEQINELVPPIRRGLEKMTVYSRTIQEKLKVVEMKNRELGLLQEEMSVLLRKMEELSKWRNESYQNAPPEKIRQKSQLLEELQNYYAQAEQKFERKKELVADLLDVLMRLQKREEKLTLLVQEQIYEGRKITILLKDTLKNISQTVEEIHRLK